VDKVVYQEKQVSLDLLDPQVLEDLQGHLVPLVLQVNVDLLELKGRLDHLVLVDQEGQQALLAQLEKVVPEDHLAHPVNVVQEEKLENKGQEALQDPLAHLGLEVTEDQKVSQGQLGELVP